MLVTTIIEHLMDVSLQYDYFIYFAVRRYTSNWRFRPTNKVYGNIICLYVPLWAYGIHLSTLKAYLLYGHGLLSLLRF